MSVLRVGSERRLVARAVAVNALCKEVDALFKEVDALAKETVIRRVTCLIESRRLKRPSTGEGEDCTGEDGTEFDCTGEDGTEDILGGEVSE